MADKGIIISEEQLKKIIEELLKLEIPLLPAEQKEYLKKLFQLDAMPESPMDRNCPACAVCASCGPS